MTDKIQGLVRDGSLWPRMIALSLLASVAIRVALLLIFSLSGRQAVPWSFSSLWAVGFLALAVVAAKYLGSTFENFVGCMFWGGFGSLIVGIFLPESFVVFRPRYFGIESRVSLETHEMGAETERREYDSPLSKGFLYRRNDPGLMEEAFGRARDCEYVGGRGFLFWQTGFAAGYDPAFLDDFPGGRRFPFRIELFFTVGPLMLVEAFLVSLTRDFPLVMLFVAVSWIRYKENLWFEPLIRHKAI